MAASTVLIFISSLMNKVATGLLFGGAEGNEVHTPEFPATMSGERA